MLPKVAAYQAVIFDGRTKPVFTEPTKKCGFVFDLFGVDYYDPRKNKVCVSGIAYPMDKKRG